MTKSLLRRKQYHDRLELHRPDSRDVHQDFKEEVKRGLGQTPKRIPPKFFYDEKGSALFERITETEEYYPTRTEAWILENFAQEIVEASGPDLTLVEFGSGSSAKTRILLDILSEAQDSLDYVPIDISPTIVREHGHKLLEEYPSLNILGLICDYNQAFEELNRHIDGPKLMLFLGSTIGNFDPEAAGDFLTSLRNAMGPKDRLLLGVDLVKAPEILTAAYNDSEGVTAEFNLNLLDRINAELGGRFDRKTFRHKAFFNEEESRIEMHLESLVHQVIPIEGLDMEVAFAAGETIHTENSYKYNYLSLERMLRTARMRLQNVWHDPKQYFALNLLTRA